MYIVIIVLSNRVCYNNVVRASRMPFIWRADILFARAVLKPDDDDRVCQNNTLLHTIPANQNAYFYFLNKLYAHAIETINIQFGI